MRKVTIYSTVGKKHSQFDSSKNTWGELKTELRAREIDYSRMKVVVGETKNTLESEKALLPEGEFTLFLMPVKTKSGSERKELMEKYKASEEAQLEFKRRGLQITRMKTDDIKKRLMKIFGKGKKEVKKEVKATKEIAKKAVSKAVEKVINSGPSKEYTELLVSKLKGLIHLVEIGEDAVKEAAEEQKNIMMQAEATVRRQIEVAAQEAEDKIIKELDKTAHSLASEFSDVRDF